ncbi:ABC transporter permease [Kineococcus sp. SYSU DK005]|uniref:ABC transporter permease n=1 Tax=Kineococcus sp. SYSU DK005 TaxID=3383126 RepID=UPI003D7DDCBF
MISSTVQQQDEAQRPPTPRAPRPGTRLRKALLGRDTAIIALLVIVWLVASRSVQNFDSPQTVYYLLLDVFPVLLIALPMTMVIVTGEIDLSVASMMGLSSVVVGVLHEHGVGISLAIVVALIIGLAGGALNGFLVTAVGLPSLAVTVGTLALYRGLAVGLLGTTAITGFPEQWRDLVSDRLFGRGTAVPGIILMFVALAVIFAVVLHFTTVGRAIYAMGLNTEASIFSGISVGRVKFWLFVVTGLVSSLAGIYWTLRYDSARGDNATGLELSVVAAVLVGGVSIFGGRGALPGVIAGVLVIGTLRGALRLADVSSDVINVATGVLLVLSVLVPAAGSALRHRRRRPTVRTASF